MAVEQLTAENVDEIIEGNEIVVIQFWTPDLPSEEEARQAFEQAANRHPEAVFVRCNATEQNDVAAMFKIDKIPTLVVFRQQVLVFGQAALFTTEVIDDLMGKVNDLDMDEVRARLSEEPPPEA